MNYLSNIVLAIIIILLAIDIYMDIYFTKITMDKANNHFNKQRVLIQEKVPTEELFIIDEEVLWI